jgi:hypothetical protein
MDCCGHIFIAAHRGHLECLKYLHENKHEWHYDCTTFAAANGHLECLKYCSENGCELNSAATAFSAAMGKLDCLKYCIEKGFKWDNAAAKCAANEGNLECLKYCIQNNNLLDDFSRCKTDPFLTVLDDDWWRNYLFSFDLSTNKKLQEIVNQKKQQIETDIENSKILYEELNLLPKDIVKYNIQCYF